MKLERLIAVAIAALLLGGSFAVHADKNGKGSEDRSNKSENKNEKYKDKDKARGDERHDQRAAGEDDDKAGDKDQDKDQDEDKSGEVKKDPHDRGLHLGHYKNGKADEEGAPATRPATRPATVPAATPAQPVAAQPAAGQPAPVATAPAIPATQHPAPAEPAPAQVVPRPADSRDAAAEARRLERIVREIHHAAKERDAELDEAYAVACREHRPNKFEERSAKILARYDALVLRLLGREELIARLAEKDAEDRQAKAPAEKPGVSKGSSRRELEASHEVIELRAKLRRIEAEIADEKDDSADRLETLQAARKRFEFKRDWEEVQRIDRLIALERDALQKRIGALDRKRSATALELTRAQKDLAGIRRENEDDDSARRRVADLDRQISERKQRLAGTD